MMAEHQGWGDAHWNINTRRLHLPAGTTPVENEDAQINEDP